MSFEDLFEHALQHMEAGHFEQARDLWSRTADLLMEDASEEALGELPLVSLNQALCCLELNLNDEASELCEDALEECGVPKGSELGQRLLHTIVESHARSGDLESARAASEAAWQALEDDLQDDCSVTTVVNFALQRAGLARDMNRPDDGEEALATGFEHLDALLALPDLDPETEQEALVWKARLFEARAQNRYEGKALEIAQLDLEDAVGCYAQALGEEHPETRRARDLLSQLLQN